MRSISRIIINAASSYAALGVAILINLLVLPFVIRNLGKELFGLIAVVQSLQFVVTLAGSGLGQAIGRFFAFYKAGEDIESIEKYYSNSIVICMGFVTVFAVLAAAIFIFLVSPRLNIPRERLTDFNYLLVLLIGFTLTQIWSAPYIAICTAVQKFYFFHFGVVISQITCACLLIAVLPHKPTLPVYGFAYLCGGCIELGTVAFIGKRLFPFCKFSFRTVDIKKIKDIFSISSQVLLPALSTSLYSQGSQIVVNSFLGPIYNAYLGVCLIWQTLIWKIMNAIGSVIAPQITTYQANGRWDLIGQASLRVTKYSALIGFPICAIIGILAKPIFEIWLGPGYETSINMMPWFALALAILACQTPPALMLIALGEYRLPSILSLIVAILNLLTIWMLMWFFKFGLMVVAIAWFVEIFIRLGIFQTWYVAGKCHCPLKNYLIQSYLKPLIGMIPSVVILFLARVYIYQWNLFELISISFIALLSSVIMFWFLAFDKWDKNLVLSHIPFFNRKFKGEINENMPDKHCSSVE